MKKITIVIGSILIILTLLTSGCLDSLTGDDKTTIYQSHPTSLLYTIIYGYTVNCSGTGNYKINYDCDEPEVILGTVLSISVQDSSYETKTIATYNMMKSWNIESSISKEYDLGITATISSNSYLVSDLNGNNALTISEIRNQYPDIVTRFTKAQYNETTIFIDPSDPDIQDISFDILNQVGSENAFILAKELFKWLKQNTTYQIHSGLNNVQPAATTLQIKTGDCDDLSFLYISLCRSINIPARFIRGFLIVDDKSPAVPHAWVEVFVGGEIGKEGWIPIECAGTSGNINTEVHQNFGIESAEHLRLFLDDGSNESLNISLSGLTYLTYGAREIEAESYAQVTSYSIVKSNKLVIDENGNREYQ
jgi:hypothetical protein